MSTKKEEYAYEPHRFVSSKVIGKQYCIKCGLVLMNNGFTSWAVDKGCQNSLHSNYKSTRRKFTKMFE